MTSRATVFLHLLFNTECTRIAFLLLENLSSYSKSDCWDVNHDPLELVYMLLN